MATAPKHRTDTRTMILGVAKTLFAKQGYDGVSLREIAARCDIRAPSLYHHFPDKQSLYLATMEFAFADKAAEIVDVVGQEGPAEQRLADFVRRFTYLMHGDPEFRRLLHRELLDGDEMRQRLIAQRVFERPFLALTELAEDMAPGCDPHMLAISLAGLILFHFETAPVRRFLPGGQAGHDDPEVIYEHVMTMLGRSIGADSR